ncbi:MAG: serine acetyltransferase, partial [Thiomonas sp. 14-64-326]
RAVLGLIDHAAQLEHQVALLWQALERHGVCPAETCPPEALRTEHFDKAKLEKLVE